MSRLHGFALLLHAPDLELLLPRLHLGGARRTGGRGIGGALYERVREEAVELGATASSSSACPTIRRLRPIPPIRKQNAARLRFYERYGARPLAAPPTRRRSSRATTIRPI